MCYVIIYCGIFILSSTQTKLEKWTWVHITYTYVYYSAVISFFTLLFHSLFYVCIQNFLWRKAEGIWLRGSRESVPRAKFLAFVRVVEYRTIQISVKETGVSRARKKKRKEDERSRFMHEDIQSNPTRATRAWKHYIRAQHVSRLRYARYILRASLSARENACGCCAPRSGSCGILQVHLRRGMERRVGYAK